MKGYSVLIRRTALFAVVIMVCAFSFPGCGPANSELKPTPEQQSGPSADAKKKYVGGQTKYEIDGKSVPAVSAANDFAFMLNAELIKQGEGSYIASPYAVFAAVRAIAAGADELTRGEILKSLNFDSNEDAEYGYFNVLNSLINNIKLSKKSGSIQMANALVLGSEEELAEPFGGDLADKYHMDIINAAAALSGTDAINKWVNKKSGGNVPFLVDEWEPSARLLLATSAYFSDQWKTPFDPGRVEKMAFHGTDGVKEMDFMIQSSASLPYYEDGELQAYCLDYLTGSRLMLLLPKDGDVTKMMSGMNSARFADITANIKNGAFTMYLPSFKLNTMTSLADTLRSLGMNSLLDKEALTNTLLGQKTALSGALHAASLEVGVTGSAINSVPAAQGSQSKIDKQGKEIYFDKPFALVLYAPTPGGGQILFTGVFDGVQ